MLLALGLAFGIDYLDDTVKTPEDITRRLKLPFLGLVPAVRGESPAAVGRCRTNSAKRSARSARRWCSRQRRRGRASSRSPARSRSKARRRRRATWRWRWHSAARACCSSTPTCGVPGVRAALGIENTIGLSHLLAGQARVRETIRRTSVQNLWVMTAGLTPPNPSELLASDRMKTLISNLQTGSVRLGRHRHAAGAGRHRCGRSSHAPVSGVVFVIGSEMTQRRLAERAVEHAASARRKSSARCSTALTSSATSTITRVTTATSTRTTTGAPRLPRERRRDRRGPIALVLLLLWPVVAFGGRSAAVAIPFSLACLLFALVIRAAPGRQTGLRTLDYTVSAIALLAILQAVPVPRSILDVVSPHSSTVRTGLTLGPEARSPWLPLSIDQRATIWASLVTLGAFALFFAARRVFAHGGIRATVRGISAIGLCLSAVALAQAATAGRLIYWRFHTDYEGPLPFGPFVNRNHFATWAIMAAPLCLGYIAARANRNESPAAGGESLAAKAMEPSEAGRRPRGLPGFTNRRTRLARLADGLYAVAHSGRCSHD